MTSNKPRRKTTFQAALLRLLLGTLLLTVGGIGVLVYYNSIRAIEALRKQHFQLISIAVAREVQEFFKPAYRTLFELQTLGERDLLPLDDPALLGALFAERIRYIPSVSWMSYSDLASGRFVGVWRSPRGSIVLNRSAPTENAGRPTEMVLNADGSSEPFEHELPGGYDPREKPWFRGALKSNGVFWSEIYTFAEGRRGISASLKCMDRKTGEPRGVLTADFFLDDITAFLSRIDPEHRRMLLALTQTGEVFGLSSTLIAPAKEAIRQMRQIAPSALQGMDAGHPVTVPLNFPGEEGEMVFASSPVDGNFQLITGVGTPDAEFLGAVRANAQLTLVIGILALAAAAVASIILARRLGGMLGAISHELEEVGQFQLTPRPWRETSLREIDVVHDSVDRMKAGLRSFGRYVPRQLVRELLAQGTEARLGGETRELTVFFSDIAGFTGISEKMTPTQLVEQLGDYLALVTARLEEERGTIDKFMGDGVLAFFNAPQRVADHPRHACRAACALQRVLDATVGTAARPVFRTRIGLHTGEVLVGNIGTPERFAYTIIGDAVNLASRLESLNKAYGTRMLASEDLWRQVANDFEWRRLDRVAVYGRAAGTVVFELMGEKGTIAGPQLEARDAYERGLEAYFRRDFDGASREFRLAATLRPDDTAAPLLAERAARLQAVGVPADWNGVYVAAEK